MNISLATAIGLAGTILAVAYTVPQLSKLVRMRSAAGVSVAALANSTISGIAWTTYGVVAHELWVALPAVFAVPGTAGAMVLAWFRGGSRERMWLPVAWAATIAAATLAIPVVGPGPIIVVLGCSVTLMVGPAAITAWRSHDVSALAASAWAMLIVDALLAGAYGFLADLDANLIYAMVAITGSLAILVRIATPAHVHARLVPLTVLDTVVDPDVSRDELSLAA
ncbi:PQ-loop domain-containing transporter [Nocardioides sp. CN2-186]|uniref:PQ-loop domain-containing transporter n=1 Tax=Nocardioides tweenelious TaxID=3156607 RepID=UPI0032B45B8E